MQTIGSKGKSFQSGMRGDKTVDDTGTSERKYLQSNRYDVSEFDVPETSWDFYDAFSSSGPTQIALKYNETSTDGDNLNKYLRKSAHAFYNSTPVSIAAAKNAPPPKIQRLVEMQEPNGKWVSLAKVLNCLGLPPFLTIDDCVTTCEWEPATAFAVAAMRQNIDFVAQLEKAHNKGVLWLPSSKVIENARELINEFKDFDPSDFIEADSDFNHFVEESNGYDDSGGEDINENGLNDNDDIDSLSNDMKQQHGPDLTSYFDKGNWKEIEKLWHPDAKAASREYLYTTMSSPVANRRYSSLKPLSGLSASTSIMGSSASFDDTNFNILTVMNSVASESDQLIEDGEATPMNLTRNFSSSLSSIGSVSHVVGEKIDCYELSYRHTPNPKDNLKEYAELEGISLADFHIHNNHGRKSRHASRQGSMGTAAHRRRPRLDPQVQLVPVSSTAGSIPSEDCAASNDLQTATITDVQTLSPDPSATVSSPGARKRAERDAFIRSSQSGFQKILSTMLPQFDKLLFDRLENELDSKQIKIMMMCMELEDHLQVLVDCKDKSVELFNKSITTAERNVQFTELTARLGSGALPREGFLDWRELGVPGIRNSCLDILNEVFNMAELRLRRYELLAPPEGQQAIRDEKLSNNRDILFVDYQLLPLDRWGLVYNGSDVVYKVLHILDDFRKCRELADWFGRRFYFLGNPLMLPFDLFSTMEALKLEAKIDFHLHRLKSSDDETLDWQFEKYMSSFRDSFHKLCAEKWFPSWPTAPNISYDDDNRRLYRALLVLFIRCGPSVQKTMEYEKKFIFVAGTIRGQHLMEGENGAKIEKALNIPIGRLKFLNADGEDSKNETMELAIPPIAEKKWGLDRFPKKKVLKVVVVRGLKRHEKATIDAKKMNNGISKTKDAKNGLNSAVANLPGNKETPVVIQTNDDSVKNTNLDDEMSSIDTAQFTSNDKPGEATGEDEGPQEEGLTKENNSTAVIETVDATTTLKNIGDPHNSKRVESTSKHRVSKLAKEIFGIDKPLPSKQALASEAGTSRKVARLPAINPSETVPKLTRRVKK